MIAALIGHKLFAPVASFMVAGLLVVIAIMGFTIHGLNAGITKAEDERDVALKDVGRCEANVAGLQAGVAKANAEYDRLSKASADRLATATTALDRARKGRASAEARAARLLSSPPAGIDACARMEAADRSVLEALQ